MTESPCSTHQRHFCSPMKSELRPFLLLGYQSPRSTADGGSSLLKKYKWLPVVGDFPSPKIAPRTEKDNFYLVIKIVIYFMQLPVKQVRSTVLLTFTPHFSTLGAARIVQP